MRYKQTTTALVLALALIPFSVIQAGDQAGPEERLFREAKVLIFDKDWEEAEDLLDSFLDRYPDSSLSGQALFYKGKCIQEQRDRDEEALDVFREYLLLEDNRPNLVEEAEIAIIDLSLRLFEDEDDSFLEEVEKRLRRRNEVVRYYAALELSRFKNKRIARKAAPVLLEILEEERDEELRDRAKIALLRIDPDLLKDFEEDTYERKVRILNIRIMGRKGSRAEVTINIPWALADLALNSIPEEIREEILEEGYDLDEIVRDLNSFRGKIFEISTKGSLVKIWIE